MPLPIGTLTHRSDVHKMTCQNPSWGNYQNFPSGQLEAVYEAATGPTGKLGSVASAASEGTGPEGSKARQLYGGGGVKRRRHHVPRAAVQTLAADT